MQRETSSSALGAAPLPSILEIKKIQGEVARVTGLEPATSGVTGRHSNHLSYTRVSERLAAAKWALFTVPRFGSQPL